jgi:hypothetical protein
MDEDVIVLCEDDHEFTEHYSKDYLFSNIAQARKEDAFILLGGISWMSHAVHVRDNLFWTRRYSGNQFVVIFKKAYPAILNAAFKEDEVADMKFCHLFENILLLYPFLSVQKEFGYSDTTIANNTQGRVTKLFDKTIEKLAHLKNVSAYYKSLHGTNGYTMAGQVTDNISIPTYIINLPERKERLAHIRDQFANRREFDVSVIEACRHSIGAVGLFLSIRKVIWKAIENDDDVIIICEDDHEFTPHYSREYLLENIIEAHYQGADYLSGGTGHVEHAMPVSQNRYWVSRCLSTQFIVVYKKFFRKILDEPFDESVVADNRLSEMTSNKMVLYPFVSTQRDFGYSDVTAVHNARKGIVQQMFREAAAQLEDMKHVFLKYNQPPEAV